MKDKIVTLISGTSKGIGNYLAKYYSEKGHIVIGCSRSKIDYEINNYIHYYLDITDEYEVKKMFLQIKKEFGQLDNLINNAGVNLTLAAVPLVKYESAEETISTNILGTFLMSREATKLMLKNSFGRIVNFSSMAVKHEVKGEAIYTASKAAIISFTRVMAKEVYGFGITCNVLAPSVLDTSLIDNIDKNKITEILSRNAVQEYGKFEDITNVIDFLLKRESRAITGQAIFLGGV